MVFCYNFKKKKGMGEKWELITYTAEFADPADIIFFKKRVRKYKKIIINK